MAGDIVEELVKPVARAKMLHQGPHQDPRAAEQRGELAAPKSGSLDDGLKNSHLRDSTRPIRTPGNSQGWPHGSNFALVPALSALAGAPLLAWRPERRSLPHRNLTYGLAAVGAGTRQLSFFVIRIRTIRAIRCQVFQTV